MKIGICKVLDSDSRILVLKILKEKTFIGFYTDFIFGIKNEHTSVFCDFFSQKLKIRKFII